MRPKRPLRLLLALAGVGAFTAGGLSSSGASFVAHTSSPASSFSTAASFVVDSTPPVVRIRKPKAGKRVRSATPRIRGRAGDAAGDEPTVTVNLFAGPAASGTPVRTLTATRHRRKWRVTVTPALPDGEYTAQAVQRDAAGNVGSSAPRTFTVEVERDDDDDDEHGHGEADDSEQEQDD